MRSKARGGHGHPWSELRRDGFKMTAKKLCLTAPATYQGGKSRLAKAISELIQVPDDAIFCDLCCGSGAISLAMMESSIPPERIVMVDKGPWGDFWRAVGDGSFDCGRLESVISQLPTDLPDTKRRLEEMAAEPPNKDAIYVFLVLQAGSFGGKAIGIHEDHWVSCNGSKPSFRAYWTPKPGCNRKSPVNPMMPMPATLLARAREIVRRCKGLAGTASDITDFNPPKSAVVYIDPPYKGTTDYAEGGLDVVSVARSLGCPCYVSEVRPLSDCSLLLSAGRRKGGISGKRSTKANEEWLSAFNAPPIRLVTR